MKLKLITLSLIVAILGMFTIAPLSAGAAPKPKPTTGTATLTGVDSTLGTITGTVTNLRAVYDAASNTTTITGTFTTQLIDPLTGILTTVTDTFSTLLQGADGSCQILHLELGPLDLDLLGLQVHLDQVVLDITAQSGSGQLLGNLLCAVAHLLDSGPFSSILADLTDLLTQIFRSI